MRLLDVDQMIEADARARARVGDVALMRAAGVAIARAIERFAPGASCVIAFAGAGNNGGDAFAAFAELDPRIDRVIHTIHVPEPDEGRRDAEIRARVAGVRVVDRLPETEAEATRAIGGAALVLDALLGVGARPEPAAGMHPAIAAMNATRAFVLSVDVPTGVSAQSGAISAATVSARATIALGAVKLGLTLDPARERVGSLYVADIGMASECAAVRDPVYDALADRDFLALLPRRPATADKRSSGAPLVVAGSEQFPGAAVLCASGAARAGAGYVTVATSAAAAGTIRAHLVEPVVVAFDPSDIAKAVDTLDDLVTHCRAVAIGPGLGLDDATGEIVRRLIERLRVPFVADASAFFHLAKHLDILRGKRCVLTPHEREFARLSGGGTIAPGERLARLRDFVTRTGATTLLKGRATLIDDGRTLHVNSTGTSALATAGTGDVLTGMIGTLLAQGLAPSDAARAGAYWHGLAGQAAARTRSVGVMAGDLPAHLAAALPSEAATAGASGLTRVF